MRSCCMPRRKRTAAPRGSSTPTAVGANRSVLRRDLLASWDAAADWELVTWLVRLSRLRARLRLGVASASMLTRMIRGSGECWTVRRNGKPCGARRCQDPPRAAKPDSAGQIRTPRENRLADPKRAATLQYFSANMGRCDLGYGRHLVCWWWHPVARSPVAATRRWSRGVAALAVAPAPPGAPAARAPSTAAARASSTPTRAAAPPAPRETAAPTLARTPSAASTNTVS